MIIVWVVSFNALGHAAYHYVTGFEKTVLNHTRSEIQFIAELHSDTPSTWLWMAKSALKDGFLSTM